jgi:hypothetical protein
MEEDANVVSHVWFPTLKKKFHIMFSLMLDPKFKTLGLRSFVLCSHLLVVNKERPLLKNMIKNLCFLCF